VSAAGVVIAESLRVGTDLGLPVVRVQRVVQADATRDQPREWTLLHVEVPAGDEDRLAQALAGVLLVEGGWYADFRTDATAWVIYAGQVFRYARSDAAARDEAIAYGRERGVPETQLDWPV
jgi:hypothetical protein